jgi:hypothetical protein
MTTISNGYINALLADATYALSNKPTGYTSAELKGLSALKERMTPTLAEFIGDNFEVVTHIDSSEYFDSGFDATVWRDISGKRGRIYFKGEPLYQGQQRITL